MAASSAPLTPTLDVDVDEDLWARSTDARLADEADSPFEPARPPPTHAGLGTGAEPSSAQASALLTAQMQEITRKLGDIGIDATVPSSFPDSWCPRFQWHDYRHNHGHLLRFMGIHLTRRTLDSDIQHRFRLASRVVHPDKLGAELHEQVLQWCRELFDQLTLARDELLMRAEWVRRGQIEPPYHEDAFPYQEVYERFFRWQMSHFNLDNSVVYTSSVYYWNLGHMPEYWAGELRRPSAVSPATVAAATFLELLLYGKSTDDRLWDLLLQVFSTNLDAVKALGRPWRVSLLLQKTTPDFQRWLDGEMAHIRSLGVDIDLYLLLLADAWPAPWHRVRIFFDPPLLRSSSLPAYRVRAHYVDPPVMMVITAGVGALKQLKKVAVLHLSTGRRPTLAAHASQQDNLYVDWRANLLPSFVSSKRLIIEFSPHDLVEVMGAVGQLALRTGGRRAQSTTRSFGDSPAFKRRTLVVSYPPALEEDTELVWNTLGAIVQEHGFQIIAGFESLYQVPDTALLLDSDNLEWLNNTYLKELVAQAVSISRKKVVVTLAGSATSKDLIDRVLAWNETHPRSAIHALRDHEGQAFWRGGQSGARTLGPPRPRGAPAPAPEDFVILLEGGEDHRAPELVSAFLHGAAALLLDQRHGFQAEAIQTRIWPIFDRSGPRGRALVTGWNFAALRALIYAFGNYSWSSSTGASIHVRILNQVIDEEMANNGALRLLASRPAVLTLLESEYINVHRSPPPLALPRP